MTPTDVDNLKAFGMRAQMSGAEALEWAMLCHKLEYLKSTLPGDDA